MTVSGPRWAGLCTGCGREAEVESRRSHGERVLCDACVGKPYQTPSATAVDMGARGERQAAAIPAGWLVGVPMDPLAVAPEPLPAVPGFPYAHLGAGVVIVGPTGGGRSSLVQAGLYDVARAGLRGGYLGSEVTEGEFNARAADLAARRGDTISDELREQLARVRYLALASVIAHAWDQPDEWAREANKRFDVVVVDPLSTVASTLGLDFDTSNQEYVKAYDRLVQPLVTRGMLVVLLENVGHAIEAKGRAKGASAKSDRADLTMSCKLQAHPEPALIITAQKVRSIRAPFERGASWIFDRATQRIGPYGQQAPDAPAFRPTVLMERVSRAIEAEPGLSRRALRTAVSGNHAAKDLALELLVVENHVDRRQEGQAVRHFSARPYREDDDPKTATVPTVPEPCPNRDPGTVGEDRAHRAPVPTTARGTGHGPTGPQDTATVPIANDDEQRTYERGLELVKDSAA